ncbi:MAG: hypothetical protein HOF29_11690 [Candidatus Marinimicrobia bacterium]|nr:hypothetical protein [Candidatus Neomarinimicrobiota bacterium]MBT5528789.1 hypothetical protein [Cytophagia bacterium]MBT4173734.1 hypothetical protein [Candidatus Neomarinimicrobiota bacterium]MBT4852679.1 hypothetical protein [Candidatus Neomarinimicrobiota bacterium]MBT5212578.1 hypothetical protein [Candidatus Neomarinimicrobiota bacterium]
MNFILHKSKLTVIFVLIALFIFGFACTEKRDWNNPFDPNKNILSGCTDPIAINYDPDANTNDGSCICESYLESNGNSYCQSDLDALQDIIEISNLGADYWWGVYTDLLSLPFVDSTIAFILFHADYGGYPEDKIKTPLTLGSQIWENSRLVEWDCTSCNLNQGIPDSFKHLVDLKKLIIPDNKINFLSWDICTLILNLNEFDISGNEICEEESYPQCVVSFIIDQDCE